MPVALRGIGRPGLSRRGGCFPPCGSPEIAVGSPERRRFGPAASVESCSSSIGRNSNCSGSDGRDSPEVQSRMKGPLETMDALEDALPLRILGRRGIFKFYCGKSKSFSSLTDAASMNPSVRDLGKPELAYTRKRKSILSSSNMLDKLDNDLSISMSGGMPKKPTNSSRSTASFTTSSSSGSNSNNSEEEQNPDQLLSPCQLNDQLTASAAGGDSPFSSSPSEFSLRLFSMTDLQGAPTHRHLF